MLKQVKYFQAVVRCGSFTEAAEECHISQSAISQQIQALENELGVSLLERRNRKFTVTPAGEHFYKRSLILMADFDKLCRETAQIACGKDARICVGYLKGYGGREFHQAVADFTEKYPDVAIQIITGNHEELYDELRLEHVDLVLSDQRRAFSDEYINSLLVTHECYIEIAGRHAIADMESVDVSELRSIPCILVASSTQQKNEQTYYHDIVGLKGEFLFAENLEEARLLVIGGKGFMLVEGDGQPMQQFGQTLHRVPLLRSGKPIRRNYCAFWKADNSGYYIEEFADILKSKFPVIS
ncbi:MAG: LysR family transcriptional regulator [Bacteroidales bacterium]|nr:LysR family transcriptional regulator [Lachnoclostridium sp.]MCM1385458.1 LysR family transcriptional regulator [Lachnoclostridium sp.]MCM1466256.1 LysR family transcriptional regulator [Bacteroidales bacterium]